MGLYGREEEDTVELVGALKVLYQEYEDSYLPAAFFQKYCMMNESMDVVFPKSEVMFVMHDPMLSFIQYYEKMYARLRDNYEQGAEKPLGYFNEEGVTAEEKEYMNDYPDEDDPELDEYYNGNDTTLH